MSWLEDIKKDLTITTGDSKSFTPSWLNAQKTKEYNVTEFDFPELPGTLVKRSMPRGRKYNLELYFQGDDHLEQARAFEQSADDPRAWTLSHPFYGNIIVHPTSLSVDNSRYNVSQISVPVVETITDDQPRVSDVPAEKIREDKAEVDRTLNESFVNEVEPDASVVEDLNENVELAYDEITLEELEQAASEIAIDKYNAAKSALTDMVSNYSSPDFEIKSGAIDKVKDLYSTIADLEQPVKDRLNNAQNLYDAIRTKYGATFSNLPTAASIIGGAKITSPIEVPDIAKIKNVIENNLGVILSTMALITATPLFVSGSKSPSAPVTPPSTTDTSGSAPSQRTRSIPNRIKNDYKSREEVFQVMEQVLDNYNAYLADLDAMQTGNGGSPDDYIPSAQAQMNLSSLMNYTLSNLFTIALSARQERSIILESDSNLINVAHRLYGISEESIDEIIESNNIGLNEMLQIRKGRTIKYYV